VRVLIVDNYDSFTNNLVHYIAEITGLMPHVIKNDDPDWKLAVLDGFECVILSPGPGNPGNSRDFGICAEIIRESHLPLLGVCLGHQGICGAFGAQIGPAPELFHGRESAVWHGYDPLLEGLPNPFTAVRYHSLIATNLTDELQPIAWTSDNVLMAVRHRRRPIWGVQFHPESVGTDTGRQILRNFLRIVSRGPHQGSWQVGPTPQLLSRSFMTSVPPEVVFEALYADSKHAFWLDSSSGDRFSFMGDASGPLARFVEADVEHGRITVTSPRGHEVVEGSFFEWLDEDLGSQRLPSSGLPFSLGWVGYLGYELKAECGGEKAHQSPYPDAAMIYADRCVAFDHATGNVHLLTLLDPTDNREAEQWLRATQIQIAALTTGSGVTPPVRPVGELRLKHNLAEYLDLIATCQQKIAAGESYEICLTNSVHGSGEIDPLQMYQLLRRQNPVPHGSYLRFGDLAVLSCSPERFVRISPDGAVESKPIKGTRPRSADRDADEQLRSELASSVKDRSENLMIVDLVRHDMSYCAEVGSVRVDPLFAVESFRTVHQLVSTVHARIKPGRSGVQCVRAMFPPGSMTGAPKKRTMEIIDRLEDNPRGVYSGALGYFSLCGATDLSVVIRTLVVTPGHFSFGTGGAITCLSDPLDEFEETRVKAAVLLNLLECDFPDDHAVPFPRQELDDAS
jgi:para-aminobenzoate synthetase